MALATGVRLAWVLAVPTVPVSDFAMYRESANYLSEFGHLDPGFIYMPGFVALLAWVKDAGGDLLAQKMLGVGFGGLGAAGLFLGAALLDRRARASSSRTSGREVVDGGAAPPHLPLSARGRDDPALRPLARGRGHGERGRDRHAGGGVARAARSGCW